MSAAPDGTTGEVRSFHPLDRIRLTWLGAGNCLQSVPGYGFTVRA